MSNPPLRDHGYPLFALFAQCYRVRMADAIPGFHCWQGCGGLWYARRLRASPPVVLRAESLDELRQKIDSWLSDHPVDERYSFEPSPDTY
jgi:hypothetical protein